MTVVGQRWHGEKPDLILCDLNMPEGDGIEMFAKLKQNDCDAAIVIVSSAAPGLVHAAEQLAHAYGLNIPGKLSKPLDAKALSAVIAA